MWMRSKVHFPPQALASCNPPPSQPCLCPPAPSQDPPQVFPAGHSSPAMIPSFGTDARAEPRHVAQHQCRGVPMATMCLPSRSSLRAPWSVGWCQYWFPPSRGSWDTMGHIQPLRGRAAMRCWVSLLGGFAPCEQVRPPMSLQWTQCVAPRGLPFGLSLSCRSPW